AKSFNHQYGDTFIIPKSRIDENVMTIKGTDGKKMSKTYNNTIDIFADEKLLKKQVMSIITDSKGLNDKKDPSNCNIFNLFKLIATEKETNELREKYKSGGYGYGHAKKDLLCLIMDNFENERKVYFEYMQNKDHLNSILKIGENKAREIATNVLDRVKIKLGF
ncbi:MAG: tryptophan--tRNA ligase, partial [Flammeovirgaceae bacterium]|nr:tryptophan--tRNA ligase [Flammeovirgaceae bacterium]